MGVYIKGLALPDKCIKCKLMRRCGENDLDYVCMPAGIYVEDLTNAYKPRPDYCPLFPVPDHGRLIYADTLNNTPFMIAAIDKVITERRLQIEKWGEDTDNSPFEWMSILGEEFGELCEAINETFFRIPTHPERGGYEKIIKEASQVAAVALAIIESSFAPYTIIPAEEEKS